LQVTVDRIRLKKDDDNVDISSLVPVAPIDAKKAMGEIEAIAASIEDGDYRRVCQTLLSRHKEAFMTIPAAKSVHHGFLSGLLMHTLNMLRTADFLSGLYGETVDRSLLLAGTCLHDLGKEREFQYSDLGLVTEYSVEGELLGHLVMGAQEIREVCRELSVPEDKAVLLQHLILSHHGEPEFGAAVRPICAEAELLSLIDKIDSRMEIYRENLEALNVGEFSQRIFALDNKIYRHK
ncbi:MAG: HD domain-containing protein, partial [Oscillospiraceae bacterium]|nr:HD domain-containing protein [Oscillospiraceae bacterium]